MLIIVLAYLVGAIPGGYLLNRLTHRLYGPGLHERLERIHGSAIYSSLADIGKGALVAWAIPAFGSWLQGTPWNWLVRPFVSPGLREVAALLTAVAGHVLSVYVCGWGGRGISVTFGAFLVLAPVPALCALGVCAVVAALTRTVWKGAVVALWVLPALIWYFDRQALLYQGAALAIALVSVATHFNVLRPHASRSAR